MKPKEQLRENTLAEWSSAGQQPDTAWFAERPGCHARVRPAFKSEVAEAHLSPTGPAITIVLRVQPTAFAYLSRPDLLSCQAHSFNLVRGHKDGLEFGIEAFRLLTSLSGRLLWVMTLDGEVPE